MQTTWDNKYSTGLPSLAIPDPFFYSVNDQYFQSIYPNGGAALDLAAGSGRHSILLAQADWQVTAVDISPVAIQLLKNKSSVMIQILKR